MNRADLISTEQVFQISRNRGKTAAIHGNDDAESNNKQSLVSTFANGRNGKIQQRTEYEKDGVGILVTTHQLDFAQKVANKILLINHGQLVFSDSVKDSLDRLNKQAVFEISLSRSLNDEEVGMAIAYCEIVNKSDLTYRLSVKDQKDISKVLKMLSELPIVKIQTVTRGLDEIFKHYAEVNDD